MEPAPHLRGKGGRRRFVAQVVAPALAVVAVTAALIAALAFYSARESDRLALQREQSVIETVLARSITRIAHDQEGVTVWDDAVLEVRAGQPDIAWLDNNLGAWMRVYFGHDESYVLDGKDRPLYAMQDGARVPLARYGRGVSATAAPLVASLRAKLRRRSPGDVLPATLSPGAIDLGIVHDHPAIVSVKPITSDTGRFPQVAGTEPLHIAVRYLDTDFVRDLANRFALKGAVFSRVPPPEGRQGVPLRSSTQQLLGYVSWVPFRPGSLMVARVTPILAASLFLIFAMVAMLLRRIHRSTLQLQASEAQAQHLAFHDPLTGLANRTLFEDRLAHHLAQARVSGTSLALLYLDLDGFKQVNDTLGHPAGDELIQEVATRLSGSVRTDDLVARIGGDEFAVVQLGIDTPAAAEILCMRIIEEVNRPFEVAGTQAHVGISMGVAFGPRDAAERIDLARKADIALYRAKAAGRGRYVFFTEEMDASLKVRNQLEADLRDALATCDDFEVYYQPLHSAHAGTITGVEALIRWRHPQHGTLFPSLFIPIAEETGLIEALGEWVLDQSCRAAAAWPIACISVNVSAVQLRNADFADRVFAILEASGLAPDRLELEITETSFIENAQNCQPNLAKLRAHGVKIALDDFGTGYSSFSHLRSFDIDRIKIDRSFVSGITSGSSTSPIICAIIDLAKASGLKVTAEGVETAEQRTYLSRLGCNSLQGFLLSRPMPREAMDATFDRAARDASRVPLPA